MEKRDNLIAAIEDCLSDRELLQEKNKVLETRIKYLEAELERKDKIINGLITNK